MKKILLLLSCVAMFACSSDEMDGPNKDQGGQAAPGGSNSQTLVKGPVSVTFGELTSSTAAFSSILDIANIDEYKEVGLLWSGYSEFDIETEGVAKVQITKENFEEELTGLRWNTTYYYTIYLQRHNGIYQYGEIKSFTTKDITVNLSVTDITATGATLFGNVSITGPLNVVEIGLQYSKSEDFSSGVVSKKINVADYDDFSINVSSLTPETTYYYRSYIKMNGATDYSNKSTFVAASVLNPDYTSGTYTFKYNISNPREGEKATVSTSDSWITGLAYNDGIVSYSVSVNTTGSSRSGNIILKYVEVSTTFTITQSAATLTFSPSSDTCDYTSGQKSFGITISNRQADLSVSVQSDVSWITGVSESNGTVSYRVAENNSGSSRTGKITVTYAGVSKEFSVTQSYSASSISLSSTSCSHGYHGSSNTFNYTVTNPREGQRATVTTTDSWITGVTDNNGKVSYKVSRNITGSSRSGKITVKYGDHFKIFSISQSAASLTFLGSTTCTYASASKTFNIIINNRQSDLAVSVQSDVSWITEVRESNGTVSYRVAENNSGSSRTGKITVTYAGVSKEFSVTQSYTASSISLSPTSGSHDYNGDTYTFKYTVASPREGQEAMVSTSDSWITSVTDNNGTVSYQVAENNSGSSRIGKITVTYAGVSQEFSITQGTRPENLSEFGTANCYIVSNAASYYFKTVKGNSSTSVETVSSVAVLWESFGTSSTPAVGDLIKSVSYKDGNIYFDTATPFKEGNAVIAAKGADGTILWSWHIWFTDQPQEQVYYNNAGTMMDRNLGATSATPGDVGALGLLYQWGRKDPFLGSSSISSDSEAKSTITWPSAVDLYWSNITIEYVTSHPTTFVSNQETKDWYTSWTISETSKSIYDPCPTGWRVPDGGSNGVWQKARFDDTTYDRTNKGISFNISSPSTTWYPCSGYRGGDGILFNVGGFSAYWSASPLSGDSKRAYCLCFYSDGSVGSSRYSKCAEGLSVRCVRESK